MFTDTHSHIFNEYYDNIEEVIKRAEENGINKIISAADNINSCKELIKTTSKYNNLYMCLGIHPEHLDDSLDELETLIKENIDNKNLVAIGEIGLDYYWTKDNKEKQVKVFEYQLSLAEKYNLPVVIHSRDATEDTINSIKKFKVKGVMHCFSGSFETYRIYKSLGFKVGIGGVITFKNSKLKDVVEKMDLEDIVLETDSPYLSPEPYRGKTNEPKNILEVAKLIANLKGISLEELSQKTEENVYNIFFKEKV